MGFLSGMLSPLLTASSQAVAGQQQGDIQGYLQKQKIAKEDADRDLKTRLAESTIGNINSEILKRQQPSVHFDTGSGRLINETAGTSAPVEGVSPVDKVGDAVKIATATKAIPTYGDLHPHPDRTLVLTAGPDGQPVYTARSQAEGMHAPAKAGQGSTLAAPMAAKVGQFGEMLKKASDLMPATDALNVSLGNSAAQDVATHGIGAFGMHIPGTQGAGSMMVNHSPEYATYQAALSPFILAAAHALSGARINDTQVQQIRASIEIKPGDTPQVRQQKHKNVIDLINSIGGSLPPDAIGAQEDQMEPTAIAQMKGLGYRPANRKGAAPAAQRVTTGASDPGGDIDLGGPQKASHAQALWDQAVKLHGEAKVVQEYGPRPAN